MHDASELGSQSENVDIRKVLVLFFAHGLGSMCAVGMDQELMVCRHGTY